MLTARSTFVGFDAWSDVLAHVREGHRTYYHAPLDYMPRGVIAVIVGKRNDRLRIVPDTDADSFTVDKGHLDRFRKIVLKDSVGTVTL